MGRTTFSESLYQAELMLGGIRDNQAVLAGKGLDSAFVGDLSSLHQQTKDLDREQERLKALLKEQTEKLTTLSTSLGVKMAEAKKRIKLEIAQARWKEFGIADSR